MKISIQHVTPMCMISCMYHIIHENLHHLLPMHDFNVGTVRNKELTRTVYIKCIVWKIYQVCVENMGATFPICAFIGIQTVELLGAT
jgi:hypothetical protein